MADCWLHDDSVQAVVNIATANVTRLLLMPIGIDLHGTPELMFVYVIYGGNENMTDACSYAILAGFSNIWYAFEAVTGFCSGADSRFWSKYWPCSKLTKCCKSPNTASAPSTRTCRPPRVATWGR